LIEEARLNPVNGFGVGKMVDKVNETRRDGDLAQDLALVPAGYGGDLREILRLQGDGLGGQLIAEFRRQPFTQVAAPIQRDAEAAGIRPLRSGVFTGRRQGGGEKNGCDSGFHFSNLSTINFKLTPGLFQPVLNPGYSFKHLQGGTNDRKNHNLIHAPNSRTKSRRKTAVQAGVAEEPK
jgi:hypothetical protein